MNSNFSSGLLVLHFCSFVKPSVRKWKIYYKIKKIENFAIEKIKTINNLNSNFYISLRQYQMLESGQIIF